jgi:poly(3-hydroxyalkanoate) synthetase
MVHEGKHWNVENTKKSFFVITRNFYSKNSIKQKSLKICDFFVDGLGKVL